jgi:hypothetical protein
MVVVAVATTLMYRGHLSRVALIAVASEEILG